MDPEQPVPGAGDGVLLDDFTPRRSRLSSSSSPARRFCPSRSASSAARSDDPRPATARSRPSTPAFAMYAVGMAMNAEMKAAVEAHVDRVSARSRR